ncbi:hypothetical protein TNCV_1153051 [Trichonephila clavipes]|nr:hypothetical protein TNCV_1153051 [Trichonephila clavipes]
MSKAIIGRGGQQSSSTTEITTARIGEMIRNDRWVTLREISSKLGHSYVQSSALKQLVTIHSGMASSAARPSQCSYTPKNSCPVRLDESQQQPRLSPGGCLGIRPTVASVSYGFPMHLVSWVTASSALEQLVAIHSDTASSAARPSQWRNNPKNSCPVRLDESQQQPRLSPGGALGLDPQ